MVGRATLAVGRTLFRLLRTLHHQAADALGVFLRRVSRYPKSRLCIEFGVFRGQPQTALRDFSDTAPLAMHHSKNLRHQLLRRNVSFPPHRPRVLVLHLVAAFFQLRHAHVNSLQQVKRLKPGHDDGDLVFLGQGLILLVTHYRAHVTRREESLHVVVGRPQDHFHRRRHQHVRHQHRVVLEAHLFCLKHRHRIRRRGRFKSDREEHHLLIGILGGNLHRIGRRVHNAHIAPGRLHAEQIAGRARHPQHVSKRAEDDVGLAAICSALSISSSGVTHTGHPGPCTNSTCFGIEFIDPVLHDRVRLPAADFHQRPRARHRAGNRLSILLRRNRVAILFDVLHASPTFGSSSANSPICFQVFEGLQRLGLIHHADGKANMHDHVFAFARLRARRRG